METVKGAVCVIVKNGVIDKSGLAVCDAELAGVSCGERLAGEARKIGLQTALFCDKADIGAKLDTAVREGGYKAALILFDCFPLVCAADMARLGDIYSQKGAVALVCGGEPVAVFADVDKAVEAAGMLGVVATEDFATLKVCDARSLYEANQKARMDEFMRRLDDGVIIPCADGVVISPDAVIEPGATVLAGSSVRGGSHVCARAVVGPCSNIDDTFIGEGAVFKYSTANKARVGRFSTVGPYTQLRPDSVLGERVKVGDFVEIKNSTVGDGTSVAHLTYIGDADVGRMCNFGCGVVFVNYDGENKYRTVVKDHAFIGCNTNLIAPVTVGEAAFTAAGATVTEDVPDGALAIAREKQRNIEGWGRRKLKKYVEKHQIDNK